MTEKTDLDKATDERNRLAKRFSDCWEKTPDSNKILFNTEMDKIYKSAKEQDKRYEIIDKIKSLDNDYKRRLKWSLIFSPIWATIIFGYILFFQEDGDKFISFLIVFGIWSMQNFQIISNYNNQKNSLSAILDTISISSEYDLQSAWLSAKPHWLFKYYNHDFCDENGIYSEMEKIKSEIKVEQFRIRLLHDIESDIFNSKPMMQRELL